MPKNIFVKKKFGQKNFDQKIYFGPKEFLVKKWSKKFLVKKIFGQKNFGQKISCQKNFWVKIILGRKNFGSKKKFGFEFFLSKNNR